VAHRFTPTAFLICGAVLIWIGNFLFVYVFAALACARRFSQLQVVGVDIVPLVSSASSILAALAVILLMWTARRRLRDELSAATHSRFISLVTLGLGGLALVALLWVALPPLLMDAAC
jgi:hypothetical protein